MDENHHELLEMLLYIKCLLICRILLQNILYFWTAIILLQTS